MIAYQRDGVDEACTSQLVRRIECGAPGAPWLIALHGDGGDVDELLALCRAAAPSFSLCAVQGPFSRNPFLASGHGDARLDGGGAYNGYAWFRHDLDGRPEGVSFADSVVQLDLLVAELLDDAHGAAPLCLLGRGDGATLALAVRARRPRHVAGVIAIDAETATVDSRDPSVLCLTTSAVDGDASLARSVNDWLLPKVAPGATETPHGNT